MAVNGWNCRIWIDMVEYGWNNRKWLYIAGNGWKWLEVAGSGWTWQEWLKNAGNGWKWMKMTMLMLENQMGWPYYSFDCVLQYIVQIIQ